MSSSSPKPGSPKDVGAATSANTVRSEVRASLTDSPWFWMALFGGMAMASLLVVEGKFTQRQARLEQRYQNRLAAQQAKSGLAVDVTSPVEPGYEEPDETPDGVSMRNARARTTLVPLMGVASLILVVGVIGLIWQCGGRRPPIDKGR